MLKIWIFMPHAASILLPGCESDLTQSL